MSIVSLRTAGVDDNTSEIIDTSVSNLLWTKVLYYGGPHWLLLYKKGPKYISRALYWHVGLHLRVFYYKITSLLQIR
jgi:hypothetical protein